MFKLPVRFSAFRRLVRKEVYVFPLGYKPLHATMTTTAPHSMPKTTFVERKQKKRFHKRTKRERDNFQGSTEDVLRADVQDLLKVRREQSETQPHHDQADEQGILESTKSQDLPERFSEVDVSIEMISSTGDGLGFSSSLDHVFVVPFSTPGDVIRAKVITHFEDDGYSLTDFLQVKTPGPMRDDDRIKCGYFARCSGCQFQMLSYDQQLAHKKAVVERAYRHFSNLAPELIPQVIDTMASPLQYGYRTKLTPHFDRPPGTRRGGRAGQKPVFSEVPPIGYMLKGTRKTLDIEDCPIGTDAVREGMKSERTRVKRDIGTYSSGATLLLRESTDRVPDNGSSSDGPGYHEVKKYITDNNATSKEYIGDFVFVNPAGAFFQNNNSILAEFTGYVRDLVATPSSSPSDPPITHLIDAYCGSGLFTICLSPLKLKSVGIDIAPSSIECAQKNAKLNGLSAELASFKAADAAAIFADVTSPPAQTVVIIDPPRKGCDMNFLNQLLAFGPKRLVYVSCNVHTQARDVAVLVDGKQVGEGEDKKTVRYELKSLRGLDFFPQSGHVESVALLDRVSEQ